MRQEWVVFCESEKTPEYVGWWHWASVPTIRPSILNPATCSVGPSNHQVAAEPPGDEDVGERGDMPGRRRCHPLVALASLTPRALSCSVPWPSGRPCTRTGSATFLSLNVVATDSMLAIAFPLPPWVTKAT